MTDEPGPAGPAGRDSPDAVTVRRVGAVVLITLNRPESRNAMTSAMATAIGHALDDAESDPTVGAVVVTGAGSAFCAGGDRDAIARGESIHSLERPDWGFAGMRHHFIDKPVIVAVNGAALGGGFEMCLAADLAIAADGAELGLPEVTLGVPPNPGGTLRLMHQLPRKLALELILTGRRITAAEAFEWGLVNEVVPGPEVVVRALRLAAELASSPSATMRATKRMAYGAGDGPLRDEATRWFEQRT